MEKKQIQEERIRNYFKQAASDILKSEGLKAISVRNIADRAGYSFATLYNYFKDVKDLIFECVSDFQKECEEEVRAKTNKMAAGKERIAAAMQAYLQYFIQYPGIFELFFIEKLSDITTGNDKAQTITSFTDRLCADDWEVCAAKKIYTAEQIKLIQEETRLVTTSLLLFYLYRRTPSSYKEFKETATTHINNILNR